MSSAVVPDAGVVPIPRWVTWVAIVSTSVGALAISWIRSRWIPDAVHDPFNICLGIGAAVIAWTTAMTFDELGLARSTLRTGFAWGASAFGMLLVGISLAARFWPWAEGKMAASTGFHISSADRWWQALFIIPVATVLMEELLFRGVLLGLLRRVVSVWGAIALSSLVFGLWHVYPAWKGGGVGGFGGGDGGDVGHIAMVFAATLGFGLILGAMRWRSGSLLAPIGAHLGVNSVVYAVTWEVVNG